MIRTASREPADAAGRDVRFLYCNGVCYLPIDESGVPRPVALAHLVNRIARLDAEQFSKLERLMEEHFFKNLE